MELLERFKESAEVIKNARAVVINTGAGMGVDSGLPDFRGDKGFWKAYPLYERLGISFVEAANPSHFAMDPAFGWGFYGHRAALYHAAEPHAGYQLLLAWIDRLKLDYFVVTSNVDGHFQKAGFAEEKIYEVHGSINYLQCLTPCCDDIWPNDEIVPVNHSDMRAQYIPRCPHCGAVARPNILMFGDYSWLSLRTDRQNTNFIRFLNQHRNDRLAVIEMGAGAAVSTIRRMSEHLGGQRLTIVIRINPREPHIPNPHISIPCTALQALQGIDHALSE
ncbi:SIR2 family NAD-dependent protein deacylase [Pelotomaculum propionicicum]|uniref:protein acetyllysine N-acetyltransferase n=1 Tax=Pelotomaculum propionicicum TaxID=258475 RepID=A0A4Y7RSE6_9FIRM|nr:Sir2 family NAD-dependent protein deacetylase [Pelotomaculum propionicicum]NLI13037.1 NAD-dependent deacetylase [Peptococcaceae bacterium]TEB11915.1 NAD-dependent protein deacetylase [Pelotomaculum propionicicum]